MIAINSLLNLKYFFKKILESGKFCGAIFKILENFAEGIYVSRYAPPAKTGIKYLFRR